jgi:hypothetical protein
LVNPGLNEPLLNLCEKSALLNASMVSALFPCLQSISRAILSLQLQSQSRQEISMIEDLLISVFCKPKLSYFRYCQLSFFYPEMGIFY